MQDRDYDDPSVEEEWVLSTRKEVETFLRNHSVEHGEVGEWPAWHVAPMTSIWAIESKICPGAVGRCVIAGDHPTDYVSANGVRPPRAAPAGLRARSREVVQHMNQGTPHPTIRLGNASNWSDLAELLEPRTELLEKWANDSSLWDYDEAECEDQ